MKVTFEKLMKLGFRSWILTILLLCAVSVKSQIKINFLVEYKSYQYNYNLGLNNQSVTGTTINFIGFDSLSKVSNWIINNLSKKEQWGETDKRNTWSIGSFNKASELVSIYDLRSAKTIPFTQVSDTTIQESRIQINKKFNVNTYFKVVSQ